MIFRSFLGLTVLAVVIGNHPSPPPGAARMLFCATGLARGEQPNPLPSDFEANLGVAVVEIHSADVIENAVVRDFVVLDSAGKPMQQKRILAVERFIKPGVSTGAYFAYYNNRDAVDNGGPWNGRLPATDIRLRIRAAFPGDPGFRGKCRVSIGPYRIEGPIDGSWPT